MEPVEAVESYAADIAAVTGAQTHFPQHTLSYLSLQLA